MKTTLITSPCPLLLTLILILGTSSLVAAGEPDDLGSFDDILVAVGDQETLTLEGPLLNGPMVVDAGSVTPYQSEPLDLSGPAMAPRISTGYQQDFETQLPSEPAPTQIQNPFLGFESVVDSPVPRQIDETQYVRPAPSLNLDSGPELAAPQIVPSAPNIVTSPRNIEPAPNRGFAYPQEPTETLQQSLSNVRMVPSTVLVNPVERECPYERALRLQSLGLQSEIGYPMPGYKTGYIPYGGRGIDREYDHHRSEVYRSHSTRYVPGYSGVYSSGYRYTPRPAYYSGGRNFSIRIGF